VLWEDGRPINLGNIGGHGWNTPTSINNKGQIVGFANVSGDLKNGQLAANFHAFLWTEAKGMTDLGTLPGDSISEALGINDEGQIVGVSYAAGFSSARAFLYQDGVMTDLNTLIPSSSKLSLIIAGDINNRGEITGQAFNSNTNESPAFLAIPTPHCNNNTEGEPLGVQADTTGVILPTQVREQLLQRLGLGRVWN